ncbi:MAG: hypothetical protein ACR2J3_12310 [Aridibacter sp.]
MNNNKNTVSDELGAVGDRVEGQAKNAYGAVTGDEGIEREGENQSAQGAQKQRENRMLSGLFRDRESADRTYSSLRDRGYTDEDINILSSDETRDSWFSDNDAADTELGSKALEGTGVGSAVGGTLGAIIGGIAAIGSNVILPGLGLVIAGPLAAALAGAGAGGLTGGLVGALIGSGIPEERAKLYEEGIKNGGMVMGVNPRNDEDAEYFQNHFKENQAEHIYY